MKKKKIWIILLIIILAAGVGTAVWFFKFRDAGQQADSENTAFVDSVAMITGVGGSGRSNRFSGVVEAQRTVGVEVADGMKVKETYVTVGQEVKVGTKLFSYDTDEAQDSITQLEIDIENYEIEIESTNATIEQYEKERAKVSDSEKRAYTTSILTAQNSIRRAEYNIKSKQAEMESLKKQIANAVVTSELDGVVKTVNKNNSGGSDGSSGMSGLDSSTDENANAYITIMATGEYRIKGLINEQNMSELQVGSDVVVHSRVDESLTWKGIVDSIDTDNAQTSQSNVVYYGGSDNSMTNSSSYPFYVELEDSSGLMLGQHVYVELDNGQTEERTGMWLDAYYLITDENGEVTPYVWAANDSDRLEKREVTLGEFDEDLGQYEILDGLTADDYITIPYEGLQEGQTVIRNVDQDTGAMGGYDYSGDGMMEDGYDSSMDMLDGGYEDISGMDGADMGVIDEGYDEADMGVIDEGYDEADMGVIDEGYDDGDSAGYDSSAVVEEVP
ncbi:efflux RND transporter periplasmic adaptor subunit [Marvinbryantia formatexigens]|nr:efflux RND transporter periplasmic adaptor subunit [Marvinbryantia formatexigens]UWO25717.1 efflux RND transporter periplasmic adaptor subunit [Marvinbryantia formatexigens DSM 14469]SDF34089.1 HlyD family secretion protein [Marvinbryantia formatexigens]